MGELRNCVAANQPARFLFRFGTVGDAAAAVIATEAGLGGREFVRPRLPSRGRLTRVVATSGDIDDKFSADE
jgi:hypothetical protein